MTECSDGGHTKRKSRCPKVVAGAESQKPQHTEAPKEIPPRPRGKLTGERYQCATIHAHTGKNCPFEREVLDDPLSKCGPCNWDAKYGQS